MSTTATEAPETTLGSDSKGPLVTYRIQIKQTNALLRCGLMASRFRYGVNADDCAEFTSRDQAERFMPHAQRKLNEPFGSVGAPPLADLRVIRCEWPAADAGDVWDFGLRIKQTAVEAALNDLQGAPAYLAAIHNAKEA